MNENNIINQLHNDEKVEVKKTIAEYANDIYKTYINTRNNEAESYLNVEDERILDAVKEIYTSEIGFKLFKNKLLHIGMCKRALFFKLTGAIQSEMEVSDLEFKERLMFVKDQWLKKLMFSKLLCSIDDIDVVKRDVKGLTLKASDDGHIKDYTNGVIYTLLIKPVNDTATTVRNQIWSKYEESKPINEHLAEVVSLLLYYKKPVKIIYVGKNNADMIKEFNFGVSGGKLTINNVVNEGFEMADIFAEITDIKAAFESMMIPPRDYIRPRLLNIDEIETLRVNNVINKMEVDALRGGKEYECFRCVSCKYRNLCNSIEDGWVEAK